ncbi:MAG: PHP domain-containing protein [Elusimicrobia bacterium]|nr:PHP domain-containing protein [Elusimicrobiota bacterium]
MKMTVRGLGVCLLLLNGPSSASGAVSGEFRPATPDLRLHSPSIALPPVRILQAGLKLFPVGDIRPRARPKLESWGALGPLFDGDIPCALHSDTFEIPTDHEGNPLIVPGHLVHLLPSARATHPQAWTAQANFHLHSRFSDGSLEPEDVVAALHGAGVREFALTDHDTVTGVERAWRKAMELGMSIHPGIELSAERGIHIGALDVDIFNPGLVALLSRIRAIRLRKAHTFIQQLKKLKNVAISIEEVIAQSYFNQGGTIEIVHLARVLVQRGLIHSVDEAYTTYLTPDVVGSAGDPNDPKAEEILGIVRASGGLAFLNHPYTIRGDDPADILKKIKSVLGMGVNGIEVYRPVGDNPRRADDQAGQYLLWVDEFNLLAGNGGDFHGMDTRLNNLAIHMPIILADQLLEALREPQRRALAALQGRQR